MMRRRIAQTLCLFLLPVLLLSACWEDPPKEPPSIQPLEEDSEETVAEDLLLPETFSLPYAPEQTLDPITCTDGMQQVVASLLCEGLFRLGPDFEPEPWLCQSYTYDPAAYTYVFTLRGGVTFRTAPR